MMTIAEMQKMLGVKVAGRPNPGGELSGLSLHSREIRPGWGFVAISGVQHDGAAFAEDAVRRGAIAVVSEKSLPLPQGIALFVVPDCRLAAARLAAAFFGDPSRALRVVGITGTNGKTTTALLAKSVFGASGALAGLVGTIAYEIGDRSIAATRTTPDCITLQHLLQSMVKAGCKAAVLEVSSHALEQKRTACIDFAAVAFTNLTHDHLDYHVTMENYYNAKALLFRDLPAGRFGVVNVDDPWGVRLSTEPLACDVIRVGLRDDADVRAIVHADTLDGSCFRIESPWGAHDVALQLPGVHNIRNALTCFALACGLGVSPETAASALGGVRHIRGRLQRIAAAAPYRVFVDYAHTDDALRCVLAELRKHTAGKLRVVFGCGGGRDKQKRSLMGKAVYENADVAYVTSDNPRHERPEAIIDAVLIAFPEGAAVRAEPDRRQAISLALSEACPGDTVCIAGKGHEVYQEVEGRMLPFDDVQVASEILERAGYKVS
jgi:UDP-N-acetylmuramoyl-L-alanyl-D-glutamate--2,6-diaminopimelate ligase